MKFVIAVDLEGVPCVVGSPNEGLGSESREYQVAVREAVRQVNAAASALFDAGADEVTVWDNHGSGLNLPPDLLDERVMLLRGANRNRFCMMDASYSGVLLIGYHAMAGTPNAILAHSYSSATIQYIKVNGVEVGEMAIDAHFAGRKGVPVIFVSSDAAGVAEAQRFMPWVRTVVTKTGYGRNVAHCLPPKEVERLTYEKAVEAAKALDEMKLFAFETPVTVDYRFMRMEPANARAVDCELLDQYTVRFKADDMRLL